ncbi:MULTISPECIES: rhombotarget A [Acinetobacter]|uniref:rhombotarget A n=1 Tax=Acinetobacter TaxID=469 RepID=UPI0002CF3197|nr:rhombotarget A [Acinetobacter sp. YH12254]ENW23730.1 rhombotarget A [Acinetobacter lwoffii NCTC 5866 = CIP 64.10 = NIPH 512]
MLKKSIGMALLCMAGQAYSADIIVTTTEDIEKDDKECSLREAVGYINRGLAKEGFMGCGGENSSSTIILKEKNTYVLNKHIAIKKSLSIRSVADSDEEFSTTEKTLGLHNAHIQMQGTDNLFRLNSTDTLVQLNLKELDLEGCGKVSCAEQGGLIHNKGQVVVEYSRLFNGAANLGGAIYNTGQFGQNFLSRVEIKNSLIENNKAQRGGILYSELPAFLIRQSVLKNNQTLDNSAANIYSAGQFADTENLQNISAEVLSSTLLKNKGTLINVMDGMGLNNLTIVDNADTALRMNAPAGRAYVANSIILRNGAQDCQIETGDKTLIQNNLLTVSCGTGDAVAPNELWNGTQILAEASNKSEGVCQTLSENSTAILCPYSVAKGQFLGYMRPRILLSHNQVSDSSIVNRGTALNLAAPTVACEAADQRGINRLMDNLFCDRGAIEITVPTSGSLVGQDLLKGEIAKFSIESFLGDSDLIPKEQCNVIVGQQPTGEPWQDGCLKVVQTKTESKGKTRIDIHGNVVYTPDSTWHGADIFELQVVTTSTRFNKSKPYLTITTQIVQEPKNEMEDKSVKTSGGAWGFGGLLILIGLMGLRRELKD